MKKLRLVTPSEIHEQAWKDIVHEMKQETSDITPHALTHGKEEYAEYLRILRQYSKGENLPLNRVRSDLFFLVGEKEERILGAIDLRYELTEYLRTIGGNIGYGIRPTERRKGYATQMLALTLEMARMSGLEKVLVTCDETNTGSRRTIEKNGGVLENIVPYEGENVMRFWIDLRSPEKKK